MLNVRNEVKRFLAQKISEVTKDEVSEIESIIEIPKDETKGDLALPCFYFSKKLKKSPVIIAEELLGKVQNFDGISEVKNDGPYINFFIDKGKFFEQIVKKFLEAEGELSGEKGEKENVLIEFSSPNIAKPFHIGHIRSTVIGNAIANIYEYLNYKVVRINYLGDYGTQFGKLIVAYKKWGNKEDVERQPIKSLLLYYKKFHEEALKDETLNDEAREAFASLEGGEEDEVKLWEWFKEESLKEFMRVYDILGIKFDEWFSESMYSGKSLNDVCDELEKDKLLKDDDGAKIVTLDDNMPPALIKKSDGTSLYITRDIASAEDRAKKWDFEKSLYVVASAQSLHFKQWFSVVEKMGYDWAKKLYHIPFGLVSYEGKVMATRSGEVVFLEDVLLNAVSKTKEIMEKRETHNDLNIDEISKSVGVGAVIFNELSADRIKDYTFSWDKVLNFEGETGPYIQYTYARVCGVLRKAEEGDSLSESVNAEYINDDVFSLLKDIDEFDESVLIAAEKFEPAIVSRKTLEVAKKVNKFYHDHRIISDNQEETAFNLNVIKLAKIVLGKGLKILGLDVLEKM